MPTTDAVSSDTNSPSVPPGRATSAAAGSETSKNEAEAVTKSIAHAPGTSAPPPAGAVQRKKPVKPQSSSRIFHLFSHVPPLRLLRTVLTEMEEELRKGVPGASKKLMKQGQDARIIADIPHDDENAALALEEYNEVIVKAKESIALKAQEKIRTGDTILIYGYADVVRDTLLAALDQGKNFSLIIVESSLGYSSGADRIGRGALTQNGEEIHALHIMKYLESKVKDGSVSVTFVHLNGLSFVIRTVTKFFMTAYALLTNGGVLGRIGTAQIALMAHKKNIPVVVCCETFKFCDKSPVDSFFQNQRAHLNTHWNTNSRQRQAAVADLETKTHGQSTGMPKSSPFSQPKSLSKTIVEETSYLKAPALKYDITPAKFVTAVITEVDVFPAQSIPLLLQVQESRNKNRDKRAESGGAKQLPVCIGQS